MESRKLSLKFILTFIGLILFLSPANAAVVSVYANFEHLKIPFNEWYHGGQATIVEENGNKVLELYGGSVGRVLGVDIQNTPYVKLKFNLKLLNTTNGYLRVIVYGYPMSSEGYKAEREICGVYVNEEGIFGFNGSLVKLAQLKDGWNTLELNLNLEDGVASLVYEGEKHIFAVPQEKGRYFIFRVDPGTRVMLDEIDLKAGDDFSEFFDSYTFSKATPPPVETTNPPTTTPKEKQPTPTPLPTPDFSKLKIILDKNYEILYETKFNSHTFYIVKYYNYLPPGTGVEVITEKGFKIGLDDKNLVKDIINTLNASDVEKDLLYHSWEDRQNGVITVYVAVIAFLLFLLGLLAIIVWKT